MSIQRITCASETGRPVSHVCNPCSDKELGRVRGIGLANSAFDREAFITALKAGNESAAQLLEAAIKAGNVHIVPETTGSYNGGEPEYGDGYGDETQRLRTRNHELTFSDPSYAENEEFWSEVEKSHWYPFWRTEKYLHFGDKPASVVTTDPTDADLNSDVTWNGTVAWRSKKKATLAPLEPVAEFFEDCFEITD